MYNNQQSYPYGVPSTPGYPPVLGYPPQQGVRDSRKQAMVEKYPLQVWVSARKGMSLTCAADLNSPGERDTRKSPMEMHTGYSVFRMAIASSDRGSVVANIPADDVPYLLNQYMFQRNVLNQQMFSKPNSPAYTVPIKERNCKNKTAVEILSMPNGINVLNNAKRYFSDNLDRFPKNASMINAIDEALFLYQTGKVSSTVSLPPLYSTPVKHKSTVDGNGRHLAYSISISGSSSSSVDWTFAIFNCKAFLKDLGQLKVVDIDGAVDKKDLSFKVTQPEMDLFIYRLKSTLENYEKIAFPEQYRVAKKNVKYSRNGGIPA